MNAAIQPHGVTVTAAAAPPEWFPFRAFLFVASVRDAAGIRVYGPFSMN